MTIGIDASRANREQKTGVEWYSYYLIQEFKKICPSEGINFILYSPDKLKGDLGELPNNWQVKILKWPFRYLWTQIRLVWEMIFYPPDVLFVPAHALPIVCRAKTVITIHDLGFERLPQAYSIWQRIYTRFVYQWAVRFAHQIIVPSKFTRSELKNLYKANPNKIRVIYLGFDEKKYHPISNQERINQVLKKYKIQKPYLLYVGRLERKKNIKNLIIAYKLLITHYHFSSSIENQAPQLVLVGQGGRGYQDIKTQLVDLSPGLLVKINHLLPQELACLYNAAECFVFPTSYEGFGLPILEAMACFCPVAASRIDPILEIGQSAIQYFDPNNVEEITKSLLKVLKDKEFRDILIQKGLEQIQKYSWQKCARETLKILIK